MSFRLFGVPITIRWYFWLGAALLGLAGSRPLVLLPLWIGVVLVSIVVHELGHAFAAARYGVSPAITLHAMGGVCVHPAFRSTRLDRAFISLAGPAAGLLLGGLVYALATLALPPDLPLVPAVVVSDLINVNIAWSIINLAPVLPFDGGHVMEEILGPRRARAAATVSLVAAVLLAVYFALTHQPWGTVLFAMSAIQSFQLRAAPQGATVYNPFTAPAAARGAADDRPSGLRRWWLQWKLRRLQKQAEAMERDDRERPRRREGGPDLRVIRGGKDKSTLN